MHLQELSAETWYEYLAGVALHEKEKEKEMIGKKCRRDGRAMCSVDCKIEFGARSNIGCTIQRHLRISELCSSSNAGRAFRVEGLDSG